MKAGLVLFSSVLSSSSVRPSRVCLTGSPDYFAVSSHFGMNPTQPSCTPWAFPKRQSCFQPSGLCACWALYSESPCLTLLLCLTYLSRFILGIMLLEAVLVSLLSQACFLSILYTPPSSIVIAPGAFGITLQQAPQTTRISTKTTQRWASWVSLITRAPQAL